MKFLGNIIWVVFGGIVIAVEYLVSSLLLMATIIGIPFGIQTLKLAMLALWPFGSEIHKSTTNAGCLWTIMNIIWFFIGGWHLVFFFSLRLSEFHLQCSILN